MRMGRSKELLVLRAFVMILLFLGLQLIYYTWLNWNYQVTRLPQQHVEQVKVSEVLAAAHFIGGSLPRTLGCYNYNKRLSDAIGAFRALPDTRDSTCSTRAYQLPARQSYRVSVVIVYHNEARSALIRTVMSVWRRSPAKYLHEIILVDDCSHDVSLLAELGRVNFPPFTHHTSSSHIHHNRRQRNSLFGTAPEGVIKMQRNPRRLGLIESRNRGARLASGNYLLFLDSHCEVNVGWLEPLLERVADGVTAVSPVLDSIDPKTLQYRGTSQQLMGGFDWNLHFHWMSREERLQREQPQAAAAVFKSPTFAGGIFMISRNWFFKLNAFNSLLKTWGGEAIEFSLKLWLCGGQIEIVPCSRVGHIFRRQHPFEFPGDDDDGQTTYLRNSKIIAESWLDAHKHFFYASRPAARDVFVNISFAELHDFQRNLKCRPFAWYLQHVYPELKLPNDDFNAFGTLSSDERCLHVLSVGEAVQLGYNNSDFAELSRLLMTNCYRPDLTQWFLHRRTARLQSNSGACLNVEKISSSIGYEFVVVLQYCQGTLVNQRWLRRGAQLVHARTQLCLDNPLADVVAVSRCRRVAPSQLFRFSLEVEKL